MMEWWPEGANPILPALHHSSHPEWNTPSSSTKTELQNPKEGKSSNDESGTKAQIIEI